MKFEQCNKNSIKLLFNTISDNYDILNVLMSFGMQKLIKQRAVKNAIKKADSCENILDLCTGTGDIALLFQKFLPKSNITAVDFSDKMLEIAKKRSNKINFIQADITDLKNNKDIENKQFDICFICFGLRNLPNIDEFLAMINGFLKPNGILSIMDLGKPAWYMKPYFYFHYNIIIPFFAKLFHKDISPYKYLIESARTYPSQKEIMQKMKIHGFKNIENNNFAFGIISQQLGNKK